MTVGGWVVALALAVPSSVRAQGASAPSEPIPSPQAPHPPETPETRPLFSGTHVGGYAAFAETPGVLLGLSIEKLILSSGLTLRFDGNGLPDQNGAATADRVASSLTFAAAYIFYDVTTVGVGPSLAYSPEVAPRWLGRQDVTASLVFYFAPFAAPIVFVTVMSTRITFERQRAPVFELFTPSVLLGYLIF